MKKELLKGLSEEQIAKVKACKNQDEILALAREEGIEKGVMMGKEDNALRMIKSGKLTIEEISSFTGLPLERIKELAEVKTA